jgi:hypothetical protein
MSKPDTDYSNTLIYKITCKDPTIKDVYVGHTTNFVQRKHAHKQACNNNKSPNYKCKLYETIRKTGGWANWHMEIVNFFNCKNHYEARLKEQEYFVSLNATLNSIEPLSKSKSEEVIPKKKMVKIVKEICIPTTDTSEKKKTKYTCDCCNYTTIKSFQYKNHLLTPKHKNNENNNENQIKREYKYTCEKCNYNTNNICNYNKHMFTPKHNSQENEHTYSCKSCDYYTIDKYDYNKHLQTLKHKNNITLNRIDKSNYSCTSCNYHTNITCNYNKHLLTSKHIQNNNMKKSDSDNVSLKKSCKKEPDIHESYQDTEFNIIKILLKENQEMRISIMAQQNTIIEQNKTLNDQNKILNDQSTVILEQNNSLNKSVNSLLTVNKV